jgi:DNA-binding IclR family transcriptional regulator
VLPIFRSATGAVMVAFLPAAVTAEAVSAESRRENVDRVAFARAVERAKRTRLALVDSSVIPGLSAIASPVLDLNGEVVAAVTLIGTDPALAKPSHPAAPVLLSLCDRLSREFGAPALRPAA